MRSHITRIAYRPYFFLIAFLLLMLSLPTSSTTALRAAVVKILSPTWRGFHFLKSGFFTAFTLPALQTSPSSEKNAFELERLQRENQILRTQMESVRQWLFFEERIEEQLKKLNQYSSEKNSDLKDFSSRRSRELYQALNLQLHSLPAKVIYREPSSWSSSVWLNVGDKHNEILGKTIVAKNSPVLAQGAIIGVVEYVGKKQSRVRLITDSGLTPSVRALRGSEEDRFLLEHIEAVLSGLKIRNDLFETDEEGSAFFQRLHFLKERLSQTSADHYLAKGELYGSSTPLWRARSPILKGVGFNYDFADEEGSARDLRTGESILKKNDAIPLLKIGDLLITTGLDGVFPAGFRVGVVKKIGLLREGGTSYEIEATACAGNLDSLKHVFILPPVSSETD